MNWILGQPLIILGAGAAALVALYGVLHQTGQRWAIYAMLATVVIFGGLFALERFVITPEEAVRATLTRIARDLQANAVDAVVSSISRRNPELQSEARAMLRPFKLEEVKVKKVDELVTNPTGSPPTANCVVQVLAVGGDRMGTIQHQRGLFKFKVDFVQEDGAWRVRGYENLGDPLP